MIALFIIFVTCNFLMMEIKSHWPNVFAHWFPSGKDQWVNPAVSWNNKYREDPLWNWVFCNPLVWTTDLWHLLQFIGINSIFLLVVLLENDLVWWKYLIELLILNIAWGVIYWLGDMIFGWLTDKYNKL